MPQSRRWVLFVSTGGRDYLGPYRLVRLIRASQTAQVWEAINQNDGQRCALKALQDRFCNDAEQVQQLKDEYETAKDFQHPNIIKMYRHAVDRGIPFVAMEFFASINLKQLLKNGGPDSLAPIMEGVIKKAASALQYVHEQGWVHRDVKPDNILVSESGDVRLIDFSIATQIPSFFAAWMPNFGAKVQGTRSYMSPEQIRSERVDAGADIYSFGCTLFELFTGKLPYTGTSSDDLLNKQLKAPIPSIAPHNKNVTPEFAALVQRLMAKSKDQRPASMQAFLDELVPIKIYKKPART